MMPPQSLAPRESTALRAESLFREHQQAIYQRTDKMFARFMVVQWTAAVVVAARISPQTWGRTFSQTDAHVWAALLLGGTITAFPVFLAHIHPGRAITRHVIAISQALMSALLIHLTGGHIETHFHVFGSLAFLACYRDWRVLVSATVVVAADHFIRGLVWPQSVYGILTGGHWRFLEHAAWVLFEDIFLIAMISQSTGELKEIAMQRAELEETNNVIEAEVRWRTEELCEAIDRAKEANEAKNAFLANMSHELRTPLHGILSFSRFGIDESPSARREELRGYFQQISTSGNTLLALVSDLLDLTKLESGKMELTFQECHVTELIQVVIDEFRSLCCESDLRIVHETAELEIVATLDSEKVKQILRNLLSNAVKFSPARGTIRVTCEKKDHRLLISVADEGAGLPEDELEMIFEKFVQSSTTNTGAGGTGLGLAICREIVARHQGRIWVENNPRGGALFAFELPLASRAPDIRHAAAVVEDATTSLFITPAHV